MTDAQLLTLAVAIIVPLSLLIYSNSRITDTKEVLRAEMALGFERLISKLDHLEQEITALRVLVEEHLRVEHGWRGKP